MGLPEGRDIYIDHEENDKPYVMKNSHIHDYYEIYYLMAAQEDISLITLCIIWSRVTLFLSIRETFISPR